MLYVMNSVLTNDPNRSFIVSQVRTWYEALVHPRRLLNSAPSEDQIQAAIFFYLMMLIIPTLVTVVAFSGTKGEWSDKLRAILTGIVSILGIVASSLVWHLPFAWLGGTGTFGSTFISITYGIGPYMPILWLLLLVPLAGIPSEFRRFAGSERELNRVMPQVRQHPDWSPSKLVAGCSILVLLLSWCAWVTLSHLEYVHRLAGWRFAAAVVISLIMWIPVRWIVTTIAFTLFPQPMRDPVQSS